MTLYIIVKKNAKCFESVKQGQMYELELWENTPEARKLELGLLKPMGFELVEENGDNFLGMESHRI